MIPLVTWNARDLFALEPYQQYVCVRAGVPSDIASAEGVAREQSPAVRIRTVNSCFEQGRELGHFKSLISGEKFDEVWSAECKPFM
jgi:hypothetical protein